MNCFVSSNPKDIWFNMICENFFFHVWNSKKKKEKKKKKSFKYFSFFLNFYLIKIIFGLFMSKI